MRVCSIPAISEIYDIIFDESKCITFLISHGIIAQTIACNCGGSMNIDFTRKTLRCSHRRCRKEASIYKGTFFYKSRLSCTKILHLGHLWLAGGNILLWFQILLHIGSIRMVSMYTGHMEEVVSNYFNYFRQLVASTLGFEDQLIGGKGVVVEVDETKVAKRKNHRGHHVEGSWVVGGVERTEERKIFLAEVPNRSAETLLLILCSRIRPGSIIYSDMWRGYVHLESNLHVQHLTVNHSLFFVDPITLVHTNTIEGTWSALKRSIPVRRRTKGKITPHLFEFIWRRIHASNLWAGFVNALRDIEFN